MTTRPIIFQLGTVLLLSQLATRAADSAYPPKLEGARTEVYKKVGDRISGKFKINTTAFEEEKKP